MKKISKSIVLCLMAITVLSFSYQTSYGASESAIPIPNNVQNQQEAANVIGLVAAGIGLVVATVGAFYSAGYALGRAYGHYRHGGEEQVSLSANVVYYNARDFSTFDN